MRSSLSPRLPFAPASPTRTLKAWTTVWRCSWIRPGSRALAPRLAEQRCVLGIQGIPTRAARVEGRDKGEVQLGGALGVGVACGGEGLPVGLVFRRGSERNADLPAAIGAHRPNTVAAHGLAAPKTS